MGFVRKRIGNDGETHFNAVYRDLRGRVRSAGTFTNEEKAETAWRVAEARLLEGRLPDPGRGRQSFRRYVEETWFPHHVIELTTRQSYAYEIDRHIMPWFANMKMLAILPIDVREWVTHLTKEGIRPPTIRYCMTVLSAICPGRS
ncbi:MAG: putative Tyrosine recombinase xerD [Actinomycetia bacterium]|nr:putative Tyrosine recombinase xerD [Actinomycetes bacterium]